METFPKSCSYLLNKTTSSSQLCSLTQLFPCPAKIFIFYNLSMKFLTKVCAVSVKMIIFAMSTENTA